MAASMDWSKYLEKHSILQPLLKYKDRLASLNECKDWVAIKDGELYIWDPNTASILTTNLKHAALKNDEVETETTRSVIQTLTLTSIPIHEVERLLFSPTGSYLALVSKHELIVIQMPQRWGKHGLYEGGKERVLCKATSVAEHTLVASGICLIHAAWHPGSLDDSHIVTLTADNYIRTYDIQRPTNPIESAAVTDDDTETFHQSTIRLHRAIGDGAVGFDFGPVIQVEEAGKLPGQPAKTVKFWPVYVLCGSGDVYRVLSKLNSNRAEKLCVDGPLSMLPPAEDNYGSDACGILCLTAEPTVLVLATIDGKIYHSVVLNTANDKHKKESSSLDDSRLYSVPQCALYIYETVQLELSLTSTPFQNEDSLDDIFTCHIRLHKDISQTNRYLCSHSAGLHAVLLAWYDKMQEFTKTEDGTDLPKFTPDSQARVEHLVCTKPLTTSPEAPPLGTAILKDKLLGTCLVVLTVTLELIVLPLRCQRNQAPPPSLLLEQVVKPIISPMKQLQKEPFDEHIHKILKRDSSHPIIKTTKGTDLNPQECFMLLSQAVQVMREEYIQKLNQAKHEIDRRIDLLREQKIVQEEDMKFCLQNRNILTEHAGTLAEKYEEANEQQQDIVHRLETILRKLQARLPLMSDAEKNMHRELKDMEEKLRIFKNNIQQLHIKREYQNKQVSSLQNRRQSSSTSFSKNQQLLLRTQLKNEGDEIADLVKQISHLKTNVETN